MNIRMPELHTLNLGLHRLRKWTVAQRVADCRGGKSSSSESMYRNIQLKEDALVKPILQG